MNLNTKTKWFALILMVLCCFTVGCRKPSKQEILEKYLHMTKTRFAGTQFNVLPENCRVEALKDNRYKITLKQVAFTSDLLGLLNLYHGRTSGQPGMGEGTDTFTIDEVAVIYTPRNDGTELLHFKGLRFEFDYSKHEGDTAFTLGDFKVNTIHAVVESIRTPHPTDGHPPPPDRGVPVIYDAVIRDIHIKISGVTKQGQQLTHSIGIKTVKKRHDSNSAIESPSSIFAHDAPTPDFSRILRRGLTVYDQYIEFGDLTWGSRKDGKENGGGTLAALSFSFFIKPAPTGEAFRFGGGFGIRHMDLSIPGDKVLELMTRVKECQFELSIEKCPPAAVAEIWAFLKEILSTRDQANQPNQNQLAMQIMKPWAKVAASRPPALLVVAPFKHRCGELEIKGGAFIDYLLAPPETKLSIRLFNVEQFMKNIADANVFSPADIQGMYKDMDKYAVRQKDGSAVITLEQKPTHPGKLFRNGKPIEQ